MKSGAVWRTARLRICCPHDGGTAHERDGPEQRCLSRGRRTDTVPQSRRFRGGPAGVRRHCPDLAAGVDRLRHRRLRPAGARFLRGGCPGGRSGNPSGRSGDRPGQPHARVHVLPPPWLRPAAGHHPGPLPRPAHPARRAGKRCDRPAATTGAADRLAGRIGPGPGREPAPRQPVQVHPLPGGRRYTERRGPAVDRPADPGTPRRRFNHPLGGHPGADRRHRHPGAAPLLEGGALHAASGADRGHLRRRQPALRRPSCRRIPCSTRRRS